MAAIQTEYTRYQQPGWVGGLARPNEPFIYDTGPLYVATSGTLPRPGEPVRWNATQDAFQLVSTSTRANMVGIVSYEPATVQGALTTVPAGANSPAFVEYADGAFVKIGVLGTFWVIAENAMQYGDPVRYNATERKWESYTPALPATYDNAASLALIRALPVTCVSAAPVAVDGIAEIRFGHGRI